MNDSMNTPMSFVRALNDLATKLELSQFAAEKSGSTDSQLIKKSVGVVLQAAGCWVRDIQHNLMQSERGHAMKIAAKQYGVDSGLPDYPVVKHLEQAKELLAKVSSFNTAQAVDFLERSAQEYKAYENHRADYIGELASNDNARLELAGLMAGAEA